jgi:hypothetical protein
MSEIKPGFTRISSISSAFAGYAGIDLAVLKNAADRGTCVHKLIYHTMSDLPMPESMWVFNGLDLKGYLESWSQFYSPYLGSKIILQEERIDDDLRLLTGEPDLIIEHQGKIILMDWKCSYAAGKHWKIQASGYYHLLGTKFIIPDEIIFVRLDKHGKPPQICEIKPDIAQFFEAYDLYKEYLKDIKCNLEDE